MYKSLFEFSSFATLPIDCRRRLALHVTATTPILILLFAPQAKYTYFHAGDYIIRTGDSPRKLLYVQSGRIKVINYHLGHEEVLGSSII